MRKKGFLCLIIILSALLSLSINIFGSNYIQLDDSEKVLVLDVLDANALLVKNQNDEQALVRILGIDSSYTDEAKAYVESLIEGQFVIVKKDSNYPSSIGRWNYMHVYLSESINVDNSVGELLLKTGLVAIENDTLTLQTKYTYTQEEQYAQDSEFGIWSNDYDYYTAYKSEYAINLNTATYSEIRNMLRKVFDDEYTDYTYIANAIINYREYNVFTTIDELKFISSMNKADYDELKYYFTVTTNFKTAYIDELESLVGISSTNAKNIQAYVADNKNATFEELYQKDVITRTQYNENVQFISSTSANAQLLSIPNKVVNVNTASVEQLKEAGVSSSTSNQIVEARKKYGFTFKNLTEIYEHSKITMTKSYIDRYEDNLTFVTNINTATRAEVESLFGDDFVDSTVDIIMSKRPFDTLDELKNIISATEYNSIINHVKLNNDLEYFNINTVSESKLKSLGVDSSSITWILKNQGDIDDSSDLDESLLKYDSMFTIYTNINTATKSEILTLNSDITTAIANKIVNIANNEMYANTDELLELIAYNSLRKFDEYVVFR